MNNHFTVTNPYNNEVIGEYTYTSSDELEILLATLKVGRKVQNKLAAFERANILRKLAELLEENQEALARMITKEVGKTISDSRVEIIRATNTAIASSEEARKIEGECLDSDAYAPKRNKIGIVQWQPLGTILCITPFNFPINIAMHKIGPAFAAGNTVLLKPSPQNIESSVFLVELCHRAGIDKSIIQLCLPDLPDMENLIKHPTISAVNFTGGTKAANAIAASSGYKKLLLELGGNDPLIVMEDGDINAAIQATINQRLATAGQRCTAAKRLFVHQSVYDQLMTKLIKQVKQLKIGDPEEEETFIGPVVNEYAADDIEAMIEKTIAEGGKLTLGGKRSGNIIHPTIIENVGSNASIMLEEVFGPVIPVVKFDDVKSLIDIINNSVYGLQAGVFTENLSTIKFLYEKLDVGTLAVNDGPGFRAEHFPFGGVKESGVGREGVKYAIREMSYQKTLVL